MCGPPFRFADKVGIRIPYPSGRALGSRRIGELFSFVIILLFPTEIVQLSFGFAVVFEPFAHRFSLLVCVGKLAGRGDFQPVTWDRGVDAAVVILRMLQDADLVRVGFLQRMDTVDPALFIGGKERGGRGVGNGSFVVAGDRRSLLS